MIEQHAVAAAWEAIAEAEAVEVLEVEVEVLEVVVAGVDGTLGRFRSKGDFQRAVAADSMGRYHEGVILRDRGPALTVVG